jgi:hypothetical protein
VQIEMAAVSDARIDPARQHELRRRQQRRLRRRRWRVLLACAVAVLLAPVAYSYARAMLQPSSLPLGVRSVEWLRLHHGAWLVNDAERIYYGWKAPKKGGPPLRTLPRVGGSPALAAAAQRRASAPYAPPPIAPLIRPRLPGEGVWHGTGRVVDGAPPVLVTTFRSEPDYPRVVAYVAWIDHTRTRLALYPGRYEPPSTQPRGPMSVPQDQRWRLLATFNSGFTYADGHGGFAVDGRSYTPLQPGAATLLAFRNGTVDVRAWHGGATPGRNVVLARQNLPLIVAGGRPTPTLNDTSQWGATLGNAVRVWRSGVGVDRHGNLIYAAADYQTAPSLAAILVHAGAVRAMELDINAEWPSFITYGRGGVGNAAKLVPNVQQPASRYLVPDDRDFFAVYRRLPQGSPLVPFR